ncbi:MAG: hypothetical protein KKA68_21070 [Gammaproteobacteria bacterium]|nr:hypothetical protein [Gammaproteobacteria bacterium]
MAIRISDIKENGKRITGIRVCTVARRIEECLENSGLEANVTISYFYGDRWYSINDVNEMVEEAEKRRENYKKIIEDKRQKMYHGELDDKIIENFKFWKRHSYPNEEAIKMVAERLELTRKKDREYIQEVIDKLQSTHMQTGDEE